ncbi:hypothetical protein DFJ77DRAFT_444066 [Powellomyces hirtus]|nr:hypothetical protein DFJ77DRAFT_444066 [Powellomyces hirtus]
MVPSNAASVDFQQRGLIWGEGGGLYLFQRDRSLGCHPPSCLNFRGNQQGRQQDCERGNVKVGVDILESNAVLMEQDGPRQAQATKMQEQPRHPPNNGRLGGRGSTQVQHGGRAVEDTVPTHENSALIVSDKPFPVFYNCVIRRLEDRLARRAWDQHLTVSLDDLAQQQNKQQARSSMISLVSEKPLSPKEEFEESIQEAESYLEIPRTLFIAANCKKSRLCCYIPDALPEILRDHLTIELRRFLHNYPPDSLPTVKPDNRHVTFDKQPKLHGIYHLGVWQAQALKVPTVLHKSHSSNLQLNDTQDWIQSTPVRMMCLLVTKWFAALDPEMAAAYRKAWAQMPRLGIGFWGLNTCNQTFAMMVLVINEYVKKHRDLRDSRYGCDAEVDERVPTLRESKPFATSFEASFEVVVSAECAASTGEWDSGVPHLEAPDAAMLNHFYKVFNNNNELLTDSWGTYTSQSAGGLAIID